MPEWLSQTLSVLRVLLLVALWCAWWLWAVDWRRAWPFLAKGGWAPLVLLSLVAAYVWSQVLPGECGCLGFVRIPNFWGQLGSEGAS